MADARHLVYSILSVGVGCVHFLSIHFKAIFANHGLPLTVHDAIDLASSATHMIYIPQSTLGMLGCFGS